jgi:hypothetical protein
MEDAVSATAIENWTKSAYPSGTQVVQKAGWTEAYYHIGHLAADTEGDGGRYDVARDFCEWLNGGDIPWWLPFVRRTAADSVRLANGCDITATGPMIDMAEKPSWGDWRQDESADAKIARGLLIDRLIRARDSEKGGEL